MGKLKRPPHHGDTGITGVVTHRLTGGKISSPSQPYCKLEADIFSGIPRVTGIPRESRGMGNKIATNHVIGTGQEKMPVGVGGTGNSNDIPLYTNIPFI